MRHPEVDRLNEGGVLTTLLMHLHKHPAKRSNTNIHVCIQRHNTTHQRNTPNTEQDNIIVSRDTVVLAEAWTPIA